MRVTSDDLRGWDKESSPIIGEGYSMAADEIDRLNRIISELKDGILNSAWSRDEQYDYRSCEVCNYCEANLTKSKNKHEEGCVLLSILSETK